MEAPTTLSKILVWPLSFDIRTTLIIDIIFLSIFVEKTHMLTIFVVAEIMKALSTYCLYLHITSISYVSDWTLSVDP